MKGKVLIIIILLLLIMAGIVHERIVASRDKGLAVDWNADHKITGDVDLDKNSFLNQVIENRAGFPPGPVEGQLFFWTTPHRLYIYNGTGWIDYEPAISHGIYWWSCAGSNFIPEVPLTDNVAYTEGKVGALANNIALQAIVSLPSGSVVEEAIITGNAAAEDKAWFLLRINLETGAVQIMATANVNVADFTISFATIDNYHYAYYFYINDLDNGEILYGGRVGCYL